MTSEYTPKTKHTCKRMWFVYVVKPGGAAKCKLIKPTALISYSVKSTRTPGPRQSKLKQILD